ncbi:MAG: hypothetical protein WAJ87_16150 [Bryobacteraceae bacterium]
MWADSACFDRLQFSGVGRRAMTALTIASRGALMDVRPERRCVTTGGTIEETRRLSAEAVKFHIEGMRLRGETVLEPTAVAETVEVRAA